MRSPQKLQSPPIQQVGSAPFCLSHRPVLKTYRRLLICRMEGQPGRYTVEVRQKPNSIIVLPRVDVISFLTCYHITRL